MSCESDSMYDVRIAKRVVIQFSNFENNAPVDIHRRLQMFHGEKTVSVQTICKWCREFSGGRTSITDVHRTGCPMSVSTANLKVRIYELIRKNRNISIDDIVSECDASHGGVFNIIKNDLKYRKICTRWIVDTTKSHKECSKL